MAVEGDNGGRLIDDDTDPLGETLPAKERDDMVFHWFAHALRNLQRYQSGHAPLPWDVWNDTCATRCPAERNKLFNPENL